MKAPKPLWFFLFGILLLAVGIYFNNETLPPEIAISAGALLLISSMIYAGIGSYLQTRRIYRLIGNGVRNVGIGAVWSDSQNNGLDIRIVPAGEKFNTLIATSEQLSSLGFDMSKYSLNYLYSRTPADVLRGQYLKGNNMILILDEKGNAFAVRNLRSINIGIGSSYKIQKLQFKDNPILSRIWNDVMNNTIGISSYEISGTPKPLANSFCVHCGTARVVDDSFCRRCGKSYAATSA